MLRVLCTVGFEVGVMRIVYGVHGYGQGHATRAATVLSELAARHDVLLVTGGDAYDVIGSSYPAVRVPVLGHVYGSDGKRSTLLTLRQNLPVLVDLYSGGPTYQMVDAIFRDFAPDAVISDAEIWTHAIASRLNVPRMGFDHFGVLVHCRPEMSWQDRILSRRDVWIYRLLMGQPDWVVVSSFYPAPAVRPGVVIVGTLLRNEVLAIPAVEGNYLLLYLNQGKHLFSARMEGVLNGAGCPVVAYGTGRVGRRGNLEFRPRSNLAFIEDLAGCRAVISTAGNQLVGEAMHFSKPMLMIPEDCVEQRINALAVERLGIGMRTTERQFAMGTLSDFLKCCPQYKENLRMLRSDGRGGALAAVEEFLQSVEKAKASGQSPRTAA